MKSVLMTFVVLARPFRAGRRRETRNDFPFFDNCWLKDGAKSWQPEQT
jgi:hypothetical protein